MSLIIIITSLAFISGIVLLYQLYSLIRKKLRNEAISLKKIILGLGINLLVTGGLTAASIFFTGKYILENSAKILSKSQDTASDIIGHGSTTLAEGIGKSMQHFEEKWKKEEQKIIADISIEMLDKRRDSMDLNNDLLVIKLKFDNKHSADEKITLNAIEQYQYLFIGDKDSIIFPLQLEKSEINNALPQGKTIQTAKVKIPKNYTPVFVRFYQQTIPL